MIVYENKGYETNSQFPNEDWTGKAKYIVPDGSELVNKIVSLYPYYNFVVKDGVLFDVLAAEKPKPTEEEKQTAYEELSIKYIHERYSYDDENKIIREYLADMDNAECKAIFEAYNSYVVECKQKAHKEVYGEGVA